MAGDDITAAALRYPLSIMSTTNEASPPTSPREPIASTPSGPAWKRVLGRLGPLLGLLLVWSLFAGLRFDTFATWDNQLLILLHATVVATAAFGATIIIISGGIDLSVGATIALSAIAAALVINYQEDTLRAAEDAGLAMWWPMLAVVAALVAAVLCGLAIGAMVIGHIGRVAAAVAAVGAALWLAPAWGWVAAAPIGVVVGGVVLALNETLLKRVRLSPFIVTLGMFGIIRGLARAASGNRTLFTPSTWLKPLVQHINAPLGMELHIFGYQPLLPAPAVLIMLGLGLLTAGILRYTRFGRHIFAIGSNEATARLCGVRVERTKLLLYTFAVGLAGVSGLMAYARLGGGAPDEAMGLELQVIAAVVIGGASLAGGEGSVLGTLMGALIIGVVANGATKLGLPDELELILTGTIILAAVTADQLRHRRPA